MDPDLCIQCEWHGSEAVHGESRAEREASMRAWHLHQRAEHR